MKSEVTTQETKPERPFPKLMISKRTGQVVLFTSKGNGTCVNVGGSISRLGECSSSWDYPKFTDFTGTVTLSND